jgi:GT2 family glycosyltransferase
VAILASDDEWLPTYLERQIEAVNRLGSGASFTNCFVGEENKSRFEVANFHPQARIGILSNPMHYVISGPQIIWVQSLLVRRSLLWNLGGFDERMQQCEDVDLIARLTQITSFAYIREPLVLIDRSPTPRLSQQGIDTAYYWRAYMYRKWLRGDPEHERCMMHPP